MTKKKSEVAVVPQQNDVQVAPVQQMSQAEALIAQAITNNVPVETMERLLTMRRELRAEAAKEAFDIAMASFQGACPEILKTKEVKNDKGVVIYRYAPIESIVSQVKPLLQAHGLSYSVKTETKQDAVVATCVAKHIQGHSEESSVEVPLGNRTQVMSASQVVAAALTFAKRYAFCNAFGIMTGDGDMDGAAIKPEGEASMVSDEGMKVVFQNIAKMSRMQCEQYKLKFKASDKYTDEQKAKLMEALDARVAETKKESAQK